MVRLCLLILGLIGTSVGTSDAQPVSYKLAGDVQIGKKPTLEIRAAEKVSDLVLELARDDGKTFTAKHAALAKGAAVSLPIGDGAPGKAAYKGTLSLTIAGQGRWSGELTFETIVRAPIKVTYDADHLDLDKRELQFKLSRPAANAELSVVGEDGKEIGTGKATYDKPDPDQWLAITWTQAPSTRVMTMKLRVTAADGIVTVVDLVPWSVTIDHEDVTFATDSFVIEPAEEKKLDASLGKIQEVVKRGSKFMKMKLYVAGHTDTVGASAKNTKLSTMRARAIAQYFKSKGITIPIAFAGFGEDVLKVKTADNTDAAANRRADYVIGPAEGAPPFKGPYAKVRAAWSQLR